MSAWRQPPRPTRRLRVLLANALITALATVAALAPASPAAAASGARFEPPDGTAYLGVSLDMSNYDAFNRAAGISTHPAIYNGFTAGDGPIQSILTRVQPHPGVVPLLSWNIVFTKNSVTNGSKDGYLRAQAAVAKAYGKPFFLRINWEMNGNWSPNYDVTGGVTPQQYIASWRHVVSFFADVPNVAFVWCPNTGRSNPGRLGPFAWYPGDDVVDWIGVDSYPDYTSPASAAVTSQDGLNDFAANAAAHNKPLMLAEWARGNANRPPDSAVPIDVIFDWAERFPKTVKALVYFDNSNNFHPLEDHPIAAAEFRRRTAGNPRYLTDVVTGGQSPRRPAATQPAAGGAGSPSAAAGSPSPSPSPSVAPSTGPSTVGSTNAFAPPNFGGRDAGTPTPVASSSWSGGGAALLGGGVLVVFTLAATGIWYLRRTRRRVGAPDPADARQLVQRDCDRGHQRLAVPAEQPEEVRRDGAAMPV